MDIQSITSIDTGQALVLAPVVVGLVGTVKSLGLDSKWAPLLSIAFGVGLAFLLGASPLVGVVAGLSASGLYSGVSKMVSSDVPPQV